MQIICAYCGKAAEKKTGHANRAIKSGLRLFCGKECSGLGRRQNKSTEQKKLEKAKYDNQYRRRDYVKQKRHEYFLRDYAANPEKYRKERQRRMQAHIEYCRQPEYREKKKEYDRTHRARKFYGDFAEAALILFQIEEFIDNRQIKNNLGLNNKSQKRKRQWKTNKNSQPQT